ncbi:sensor histidine kinase [Thermanaerovibrio velox]|nr:HAMP domain-containing sensor histidine kinase [Thermanaerovibrio velox]
MAVKGMASAMGEEGLFDWIGLLGFGLSLAGALSGAAILMGKVLQERQFRLIRSQERMLAQMREEGRRARVFRELQQLVHDLRRPLTVITGLGDVMLAESPSDSRLELLMEAADGMDRMIQEILSGEAVRAVTVREVVDLCLSQISPMPYRDRVVESLSPEVLGLYIRANLMRLSRALVNLIDNGARWGGEVVLVCRRVSGGVEFVVRDRGPGFCGGSFGTGLTFVEDTADSLGGFLEIRSPEDGGCEAALFVPEAREGESG